MHYSKALLVDLIVSAFVAPGSGVEECILKKK
jgi:hypothetical protein